MNQDIPPLQGLRCPNCKSKLEKIIEQVPAGVIERRYIHTYKCPKCDYTFQTRRKTPTFEMPIKRTLARFSADIGEDIASRVLDKKGFTIRSFRDLVSELGTYYKTFKYDRFSEEYLKEFFDEKHLQNFIEYCKAWTEDPDTPSGKIQKHEHHPIIQKYRNEKYYWARSIGFGPDWVGKKDGKFYLIEVKTNRGVLTKYQKKMLLKAKDFGFIPLIIRVKVDVRVPLEEVRIKEL